MAKKLDISKYDSPVVSAEGISDAVEEIEYDFYIKVDDFDQLASAKSMVEQEQWNIPFIKTSITAEVRVRKCVCPTGTTFELTNKINIDGLDGKWELERDIERHHFEEIKALSKQGMTKNRYYYPINGTDMVWEVDVFFDDKGKPIPWVKIDLEVHSRLSAADIPPLPITGSQVIMAQRGERTAEEEALVNKLYKQTYVRRKAAEERA